jgi:hypothetical protein
MGRDDSAERCSMLDAAARRLIATTLVTAALASCVAGCRDAIAPTFPPAQVDYFKDMDGGVALDAAEVRGRNTWLMWTAGNEAFWDYLAGHSFGNFDLLKILDSRGRSQRFAKFGLMNEPGFKPASAPGAFGLWLDVSDGTPDPAYASRYGEAFPKDDFLRTYGRASGVVGLRLFPNPSFDADAQRRWDARRYQSDPDYFLDPKLVRPYRVGMACGFCHVGPNPVKPPADPESPKWENLSGYVGAQYWRAAPIFLYRQQADSFLYQVVASMPPGTVDTSFLASDNINNPRTMNAIYLLVARLSVAREETLGPGNLAMRGTQPTMAVPHVLKDGADSIGIAGALARVYISIGEFHQEWLRHFRLLIGGTRQSPIEIAVAERNSPHWRATGDRLNDVAAFFIKAARPHPLAEAPGGARYLADDEDTVRRGKRIFAQTCAACHSGKFPPPPDGVGQFSPEWDAWTRTEDFTRRMTALVLQPDFLAGNYLATDRRYPITRIGTNACAPLATNALRGHVWDNFSSDTYKSLPAVGTIEVDHPLTGEPMPYAMPGGGRGYQRAPSLVSMWTSAPYLHNNALGRHVHDPSVAARMEAFDDAVGKLLWPERRLGRGSIYRTSAESWLTLDERYLPPAVFALLRAQGLVGANETALRIGPIPKDTPVNLLANIDLEFSFDPERLANWIALVRTLWETFGEIRDRQLTGAAATERLQALVPALRALSKCPDFVTDRGHLFGTQLPDDDKRALIAFLKRL